MGGGGAAQSGVEDVSGKAHKAECRAWRVERRERLSGGEPFAEADLGDLALLLGGFAEFGGGVAGEARVQDG